MERTPEGNVVPMFEEATVVTEQADSAETHAKREAEVAKQWKEVHARYAVGRISTGVYFGAGLEMYLDQGDGMTRDEARHRAHIRRKAAGFDS